MIENAARQGSHFKARLEGIRSDVVREVRGRGLMLAVELKSEAGGARRYCELLRDRGLLAKDAHANTIRIAPPLPITRDEVDWACEILEQVLTAS
jgi:ornithine--oxo-acid transaminase